MVKEKKKFFCSNSAAASLFVLGNGTFWPLRTTQRMWNWSALEHLLMVVHQRGQRVTHSAENVIGCNLPSLQDLDVSRTLKRAGKTAADPLQPGHNLFQTLPSGRRLDRQPGPKQSSHKNGFLSLCSGLRTPTDFLSIIQDL